MTGEKTTFQKRDAGSGLPHAKEMKDVQDQLMNAGNISFLIFGVPAIASSLYRAVEVGWHWIMLFHVAIYALIFAVVLLRRHLSTAFKGWVLLGAAFVAGCAGVVTWGLTGLGIILLILSAVLGTLLFGPRVGVLLTLGGLTAISMTGLSVYFGVVTFDFPIAAYAEAPSSWLSAFAGFALVMAILISNMKMLHGSLNQTVRNLKDHAIMLQSTNNDLKEEILSRKNAEEALRKSEARFRSIAESAMDWIFCKDKDFRYIYVNPAMTRQMALRLPDVLGKKATDVFEKESAKRIDLMDAPVLEGRISEEEIPLKIQGQTRTFHMVKVPLQDEYGYFAGISGIARDITDKKKMEEEIARAEKLDSIGVLAGGVAHDFNNLLLGIQGNVSLLLLDMDKNHEYYEKLRNIEAHVQDASKLTSQLLGLARGGKYEVKVVDTNDIIRRTASMFGRTRKEIRMRLDLPGTCPVEVDRGQIEQVLLNLLVNAWQAMPGGGDITISCEKVLLDQDAVAPYGVASGDWARICITDTGMGMDEEILPRIFDPFFTTKEKALGTGLGLSSADAIIKNHGGFITVKSKKGAGSTFCVHLPWAQSEPQGTQEAPQELVRGSETVLLVDDEGFILETGSEILKALGYKVIVAPSGPRALAIYESRQREIALVILDLIMPGMPGAEVFKGLKKINPHVLVLLASGYSMDGQANEILRNGGRGFIQKPFSIEQLSHKMRDILDKDKG